MSLYEERAKRVAELQQDRFGAFIHFGLYSIISRGEWVKFEECLSNEDYEPYFEEFNPDHFDAVKWAKTFKNAGVKYVVLTTKHHEGFCLFDSKYTDYKVTNTPFKRDIVKEYTDALRAEGIKVGLYYSVIDWHHPDYPHYGELYHPMRKNEKYKDAKHDWDNYVTYLHNQVRELMTNYGKIDVLWFDFSYGDMRGEKWKATELVKMIRELQPGIVINNRLGGNPRAAEPEIYAGDFDSPEQNIPAEGILDELGRPVPWETCLVLNDFWWGYRSTDRRCKTASNVIELLTECVSKGGNMLLNVAPTARGDIPKEQVEILNRVGEWMYDNGRSIYGCTRADLPKPEWGRFTQNGKMLYAHLFERNTKYIRLDGLGGKIKKIRLLSDGSERKLREVARDEQHVLDVTWESPLVNDVPLDPDIYKDAAAFDPGYPELPDDIDTVFEIELY